MSLAVQRMMVRADRRLVAVQVAIDRLPLDSSCTVHRAQTGPCSATTARTRCATHQCGVSQQHRRRPDSAMRSVRREVAAGRKDRAGDLRMPAGFASTQAWRLEVVGSRMSHRACRTMKKAGPLALALDRDEEEEEEADDGKVPTMAAAGATSRRRRTRPSARTGLALHAACAALRLAGL